MSFTFWQSNLSGQIAEAFKTNNAKAIANFFGQNVAVSIKNDSGQYTKFQAELLLSDYFRSNKTSEIKQLQHTNRNNSSFYIVYNLKANSGTYRIFLKFNQHNGESLITELRIE
ncbi:MULTISPECIES: DUF4783 domain-containing protein [Sphingobacterium]|uniref:DUF4783 domain-containing protein n=1 Tax=Sphingobacterium tenebrionis TaxID=3111775 RepID=A0ABU8I5S8_9SPHI|nr:MULTISPECIES: DUF4783 domain-containing protein [unclassified Sphingobacterium]